VLSDLIVPPRYRAAHLAGLRHYLDSGEGRLDRRVELSALDRSGREFPIDLTISRQPGSSAQGQSCSAGLAAYDGTESGEDLVGRADAALYEAKAGGRDRASARSSAPLVTDRASCAAGADRL